MSLTRLLVLALILGACTRDSAQDETIIKAEPAPGATLMEIDVSGRGVALAPSTARATVPRPERQQSAAQGSPAANTMLIRSGSVSVRVDSIERAMEAVRVLAASLGGIVAGVTVMNGENQVRSASMELRVPAPRFDEVMAGVRPLGRVEHSTVTAVDVGEEYVDLTARVANARRLERRLVDLLATRTGRLEDVLAVERELARVRQEIERYEGRIRYFDTKIAMSSITVAVHEKAPLVAAPGTNPIRHAFVNMWRNFVLFVAAAIEALGVLVPVALLGAGAYLAWRRWRRRRLATA